MCTHMLDDDVVVAAVEEVVLAEEDIPLALQNIPGCGYSTSKDTKLSSTFR
eukprot:m.230818 g.230818  ORF g.230818 m.230818 type:complete len:51 (-) comp33587_c1_seq16:469-621(-)